MSRRLDKLEKMAEEQLGVVVSQDSAPDGFPFMAPDGLSFWTSEQEYERSRELSKQWVRLISSKSRGFSEAFKRYIRHRELHGVNNMDHPVYRDGKVPEPIQDLIDRVTGSDQTNPIEEE
mgnify:CR=1 FL=1